jgi:transposase InsO family protein
MNIAHENGLTVNVSPSRVAALMRAQRMDLKTQANARNHLRLRSLYPNHVHQIDPSLCLVYYMDGKQHVMREQEFNKNKPCAIEKVKLKVWRYVRYDHASGTLDVRYFEAAGENQISLFEFMVHTWGRQAHRVSHGVPKILLWDKGSANTSAGIRRMLDALGVLHETHATHRAWVKGGVESGNFIVERHFESRLRDEPVQTIEQLNASAAAWVRDYNANVMPHIDARVARDDGQSYVRDDLWNLIAHTPEALVEMPARDVCAYFMRGKEETRKITNGHITFVHPQSKKSELYNLQAWASEFANGETVRVSPMLMGDCVLRIELDRLGREPQHIEVCPEREFDAFGRPLSAVVIGEERRTAPHTAAQQAAKRIAATAYGEGTSLDDAEKLRAKNTRPFQHMNDGKGMVAHSHLGKAELPARLLPAPQPVNTIDMAAVRTARLVRVLKGFELAKSLAGLGVKMTRETNAVIAELYADGVPEDELPALQARLTVRAGLRVVAGGAS